MVSAVANTRLISAQYALKNLQSPEEANSQSSDASSASSSLSSMLSNYGLDSDSASMLSNSALAKLLGGLSAQDGTDATDDSAAATGDVTSASFMAALKQQLQDAADAEGTSGKAHDMLAALEAGKLTVYDPTQGKSVTAWDVDDADEKNTKGKPGTDIKVSGWSDFLDAHLERDSNGSFARENGSYIDQAKDTNAYFGQIGDDYFYLTWPQATTATTTADAK
jgi:hypothetical protein